jgi:hypothetical protein
MALLQNNRPFSSTRRGLLVTVVVLLAVIGAMYFTHAAALSGIKIKEMDWNGDGEVTVREILQSFYAVKADKTMQGNRTCTEYAWRSGATIRVECRTEFKSEP